MVITTANSITTSDDHGPMYTSYQQEYYNRQGPGPSRVPGYQHQYYGPAPNSPTPSRWGAPNSSLDNVCPEHVGGSPRRDYSRMQAPKCRMVRDPPTSPVFNSSARKLDYGSDSGSSASPPHRLMHTSAPGCFIPAQAPEDQGKYTIVFDLDETLVYAREGPVRPRPGAQQLLQSLAGKAEVVVWTAGERGYAWNAIRCIDIAGVVKYVVARNQRWCRGLGGGTKDLRKLGRDLSRTIIIENTAESVRANTDAAILVPDFNGVGDGALGRLNGVLHGLLESELPVQEYLANCKEIAKVPCRTPAGEPVTAYGLNGFTPTDAVSLQQQQQQPKPLSLGKRPPLVLLQQAAP